MINLMIDIETTGVYDDEHAIIQIGAIPFDLKILAKGQQAFKMSLTMPSDREWMPSTKEWWSETNPKVLEGIISESVNFIVVLEQFKNYVNSFDDDVLFWSLHPFDWGFIQNYFRSYGIQSPFKYYCFRDIESYISALVGEENVRNFKPTANPEFEHDALYDCMLQVDWIFNAIKNKGSHENK